MRREVLDALLCALARGDVFDDRDVVFAPAGAIALAGNREPDPDRRAVLAQIALFHLERLDAAASATGRAARRWRWRRRGAKCPLRSSRAVPAPCSRASRRVVGSRSGSGRRPRRARCRSPRASSSRRSAPRSREASRAPARADRNEQSRCWPRARPSRTAARVPRLAARRNRESRWWRRRSSRE